MYTDAEEQEILTETKKYDTEKNNESMKKLLGILVMMLIIFVFN